MKVLLFLIILICYISNILAERIRVDSKYCTQYNKTEIYLDSDKINALDNNQYIFKGFKDLNVEVKLDYYIRYAHISTGICYPKEVIQTDEIGNFTDSTGTTRDLRYFKTVVCYYMYHTYLDRSEPQDEEKILNRPCDSKIIEFYNNFHAYVHDEKCCPPPSDSSMVSVGDKSAVATARYNFLVGLYNLQGMTEEDPSCNSMSISNELIKNKYNDEIYYCGFSNSQMKADFCDKKRFKKLEPCCYYDLTTLINEENKRPYEIYRNPLIIGISSFVICFIIGMPLSYIYIKDIRTQESIRKAVAEQEKMYQLQSKRQQAEIHSIYSGYSTDPYRPHSNYGSITHQPIVPPSPQHSLPIAGNMSVHSSQNRIIRSPQPLPASPVDISSLSKPPSIQFAEISLPAPATPSLSNTPRISSLGSSSRHSSIDISDNINLPSLDISSSPIISVSPSDSFLPVPERDESFHHKHDRPYKDESFDYSHTNSLTVPRRDESSRIKHERPVYDNNDNSYTTYSLTVPRRDESTKVKHDIAYHNKSQEEPPSVPSRDESTKVKHQRRPNSINSNASSNSSIKEQPTTEPTTKDEAKITTESSTKDETKETTETTTKDETKTTTETTTKDETKTTAEATTKDETKITAETTESPTKDEAKTKEETDKDDNTKTNE